MHEKVETSAERVDGGGEVEAVSFVGDISRDGVDGRPVAELGGDGLELRLPTGVDDQLPAVGGEGASEREPEAP